MINFLKQIRTAFIFLIFFTLLTGFIYPVLITGLSQLLFPKLANGSLIIQNRNRIGSLLIGQSFTDAKYFWGRPSATSPFPYNAASSAGSNLGPSNPNFLQLVKDRTENLKKDADSSALVPVDLVTASGSGLDPDISPLAAFYQVPRIAKVRHIPPQDIHSLIQKFIKRRFLGILGEPRVNVLQLNLALDQLTIQERNHGKRTAQS